MCFSCPQLIWSFVVSVIHSFPSQLSCPFSSPCNVSPGHQQMICVSVLLQVIQYVCHCTVSGFVKSFSTVKVSTVSLQFPYLVIILTSDGCWEETFCKHHGVQGFSPVACLLIYNSSFFLVAFFLSLALKSLGISSDQNL